MLSFRFGLRVRLGLLLGLVLMAVAQTPTTGVPPHPPRAPWQRLLTGTDAKRAEELEKQIEDLRRAGQFAAARAPAQRLLDLRRQHQGAEHWETQDSGRLLELMVNIAALPAGAQAELAEADKREGEANELYGRGRHREDVLLWRQVLEIDSST
jgi:hypothetical protein